MSDCIHEDYEFTIVEDPYYLYFECQSCGAVGRSTIGDPMWEEKEDDE